jgi:hypothetical protein
MGSGRKVGLMALVDSMVSMASSIKVVLRGVLQLVSGAFSFILTAVTIRDRSKTIASMAQVATITCPTAPATVVNGVKTSLTAKESRNFEMEANTRVSLWKVKNMGKVSSLLLTERSTREHLRTGISMVQGKWWEKAQNKPSSAFMMRERKPMPGYRPDRW